MRIWGLRGLHTYITSVEDLDTFVAKYVDINNTTMQNKPQVLPTILTNMVEFKEYVSCSFRSVSFRKRHHDDTNNTGVERKLTSFLSLSLSLLSPLSLPFLFLLFRDVRSSSIERDINTDNNPNATSSSATASSSTTTTQKEHIETPYTLASMCLSDLSRSQSATTVRSLLVAVLKYVKLFFM